MCERENECVCVCGRERQREREREGRLKVEYKGIHELENSTVQYKISRNDVCMNFNRT